MQSQRFGAVRVATACAAALIVCACGSRPDADAARNNAPTAGQPAPGDAPPGMVWIPGGTFAMGSAGQYASAAEGPVHQVYVDGFFMDVHTVTNAEFAAFVRATKYVTIAERVPDVEEMMSHLPPGTPRPAAELLVPGSLVFVPTATQVMLDNPAQWWRWMSGANWRHPGGPRSSIDGKDQFPVVHVAWDDAMAYATWAGKRLPTEAEWECAARGGVANSEHVWGDAAYDPTHPQANIYLGAFPLHAASVKAVGSYGANPYGLHDMSGNVWQWTLDWFRPDTYRADLVRGVVRNPTGPPSGLDPRDGYEPARVLRGGSYLCSDSYCRGYRISARSPGAPDSGASHVGFRTVMTVAQWKQRTASH